MGSIGKTLRSLFLGEPAETKNSQVGVHKRPATAGSLNKSPVKRPWQKPAAPPKVQTETAEPDLAPIPYWVFRGWKHKPHNIYLGYFKTRLGYCHGVIKWNSEFDHSIYVHKVPAGILKGPHRSCFTEVKPGKFRVHFAQPPRDLNGAIFYVETILMEAFQNEQEQ
jgi:hypothetical protein